MTYLYYRVTDLVLVVEGIVRLVGPYVVNKYCSKFACRCRINRCECSIKIAVTYRLRGHPAVIPIVEFGCLTAIVSACYVVLLNKGTDFLVYRAAVALYVGVVTGVCEGQNSVSLKQLSKNFTRAYNLLIEGFLVGYEGAVNSLAPYSVGHRVVDESPPAVV